jgi:hypothetical protein
MATATAGSWVKTPISAEWQEVEKIRTEKSRCELLTLILDKLGLVMIRPNETSANIVIAECLKTSYLSKYLNDGKVNNTGEREQAWLDVMLSRVYHLEHNLSVPLRYIKFDWINIIYEYVNNNTVREVVDEKLDKLSHNRHAKLEELIQEFTHLRILRKYAGAVKAMLKELKEENIIKDLDKAVSLAYIYFDIQFKVHSYEKMDNIDLQTFSTVMKDFEILYLKLKENEIKEWNITHKHSKKQFTKTKKLAQLASVCNMLNGVFQYIVVTVQNFQNMVTPNTSTNETTTTISTQSFGNISNIHAITTPSTQKVMQNSGSLINNNNNNNENENKVNDTGSKGFSVFGSMGSLASAATKTVSQMIYHQNDNITRNRNTNLNDNFNINQNDNDCELTFGRSLGMGIINNGKPPPPFDFTPGRTHMIDRSKSRPTECKHDNPVDLLDQFDDVANDIGDVSVDTNLYSQAQTVYRQRAFTGNSVFEDITQNRQDNNNNNNNNNGNIQPVLNTLNSVVNTIQRQQTHVEL